MHIYIYVYINPPFILCAYGWFWGYKLEAAAEGFALGLSASSAAAPETDFLLKCSP